MANASRTKFATMARAFQILARPQPLTFVKFVNPGIQGFLSLDPFNRVFSRPSCMSMVAMEIVGQTNQRSVTAGVQALSAYYIMLIRPPQCHGWVLILIIWSKKIHDELNMSHELRSKLRHTLFTSAYANRRVRRLRHITTSPPFYKNHRILLCVFEYLYNTFVRHFEHTH